MAQNQFTVTKDIVQVTATKTATFTGSNARNSNTARAIEVWINVTAVSGTAPFLDLEVQTAAVAGQFVTQLTISGINAVNTFSTVINRADHSLGNTIRVRGVISGSTPSFTFDDIIILRME